MRPLSLLWIALFLCAVTSSITAQTTWSGAVDSDWNNAANWSAGVPSNANQPATIPGGVTTTPIITSNLIVDFDINNFKTIAINATVLIDNSTFSNGAPTSVLIVNPGAILGLNTTSGLTNNGLVQIEGELLNSGSISNSGNTIINGIFSNASLGTFTNNSVFENNQTVINEGNFINGGTVTNRGNLSNNGNFVNGFGSFFFNGENLQAGILTNNSIFDVRGEFRNVIGAVENLGDFSLTGGSLFNTADFNNYGMLLTDFPSVFNNTGGRLLNGSCDLILHNSSTVINTGTVMNSGILYAVGSDIQMTGGTGIKMTNPATQFPAPTANCENTLDVTLDPATDMAMITTADIDSSSAAPYCGIEMMSLSLTGFDCSHVGANIITLTVRDSLGNQATCQTTVNIFDVVEPIIVSCPTDLTINLVPFTCEERVFYSNALATDNCSAVPAVTQISPAMVSGDFFPVGMTEVIFVASDGVMTDTCSFNIEIHDFQPISNTLGCVSNGQLSVDLDCETDLHPSMLLLGQYGCWDRFDIFIKDTGDSIITTAHVGQTVAIMVVDTLTGNRCWGNLFIEDKGGPAITGCTNDTIFCIQNSLPASEGGVIADPTFQDCHSYTINYFDDVEHNDCGDDFIKEINRNWLATDDEGNTSRCIQTISIQTIDLAMMTPVCPSDYSEECVFGTAHSLDPEVTGFPSVDLGGEIFELGNEGETICNIKATFRDDTLAISCGASIQIIRTWRILDCCASNTTLWTCSQRVALTDVTDPQVFLPPVLKETVDNNNYCTARPTLPAAIIRDCSPVSVLVMTTVGVIQGNGGQVPFPGLPSGINVVTYMATDECGNTTTRDMTVNIVDERPPVPVCRTLSTVSLTTGGTAVIKADSLNAGSTDECCIDPNNAFSVRRMVDNCMMPLDLTFKPEITLCCVDALDTVLVELKVKDCSGNENTCMISLRVQNKLPPAITCPDNLTMDCGDDYLDFDVTGRVVTAPDTARTIDGYASDNCGSLTITSSDLDRLNCGAGNIFRTWRATDVSGAFSTCRQTIQLINNDPFDGDVEIIWPNDTSISNCNIFPDTSITGYPRYIQDDCDGVVMGFRDDTLRTVSGDAVKIMRYWEVTDWCRFVVNIPNSPGRWTHTQVIEISDPEPPVLIGCNSKLFCNENASCQPLLVDLSITVTDNCTDDDELTITWQVDAFGDGVPDVGTEFAGTGMNDSNSYPNGTHEICYTVKDGFNNRSSCCFLFKIIDCKIPTASCRNSIQTLMATGMTPVNIMEFNNNGSTDNCTPTNELYYSFSSDINDTLRNFTCLNLGDNPIEFWVTDALGNQTFCGTSLEIQDPMGVCSGTTKAAIVGTTKDNLGGGVSDVSMTISGQGQVTIKTDDSGQFQFTNVPAGHDYSLTPTKNDELRNGVSTLDLIQISRHLLNVELLDSPYKIVAADVNNSKSISTLDLVEIRKIILFVQNEFSNNNTSWRFIDKDHIFVNPANPFEQIFPEVINLNNLTTDELKADFVAVKIGDVNGDAVPNKLLGVDGRDLDATMNLTTYEQAFEKGDLITVSVTTEEEQFLAGLQTTVNFNSNALMLENIVDGCGIARENYGLTLLDEGAITISWDNANSQTLEHGHALFCLQFQTLATGKLSEWLSLSSEFTVAEAYAKDGSRYNLNLNFSNKEKTNREFVLHQNKPNPFAETTVIGFDLPEASDASLTVFDLSGKVLKKFEDSFGSGYNEFRIEKGMFNATGVLYYRLDTPTHSATRKMIITK